MDATDSRDRSSSGDETKEVMHQRESGDFTEALRRGPRGAPFLAAIAVGLLFAGWLLFYFVLFMRRGYVG